MYGGSSKVVFKELASVQCERLNLKIFPSCYLGAVIELKRIYDRFTANSLSLICTRLQASAFLYRPWTVLLKKSEFVTFCQDLACLVSIIVQPEQTAQGRVISSCVLAYGCRSHCTLHTRVTHKSQFGSHFPAINHQSSIVCLKARSCIK